MKKRRTQHFKVTLFLAVLASCLVLSVLAIFGNGSTDVLEHLINCIFIVLGMAGVSFLVFSFVPYFHGDSRWYSISALLTLAFLIGVGMLWQNPGMGMVL